MSELSGLSFSELRLWQGSITMEQKENLTHIDAEGNAVMVDVGGKRITHRTAVAHGYISNLFL